MKTLLSLIELSKSKSKILTKLTSLELNNQTNHKEYIDLLQSYKLACHFYNKKLNSLSENKRVEIINNLELLNPNLFLTNSINRLLDLDDKFIIINRIIMDLNNISLISFYQEDNNQTSAVSNILKMLGLNQIEENTQCINTKLVNEYMNQDFINLLYSSLDKNASQEENLEIKSLLLKWKYNLVLLSSSLEQRMLMTNFLIPDQIKLTDKITIEATGISLDDYLKKLDYSISSYIMEIIKNELFDENIESFYLNLIIIEVLSKLLYDKEYCEIIELQMNDYTQDNNLITDIQKEKIQEILDVLSSIQKNNINNKNNRQFTKI